MTRRKGLVLDANILLRAVFGVRVRALLETLRRGSELLQPRKRVLAAESRNPNVIGRNRGSGWFEFTSNGGIGGCCLFIYVQHPELWKVFDKPVFVALPLARLLDTISVFA